MVGKILYKAGREVSELETLFERVVGTSHADESNEVCYPDEIISQSSKNHVEEEK